MGWLRTLGKGILGAGAGVAVISALPVFGAIGAITAAGAAVGAVAGGVVGMASTDEELGVITAISAKTYNDNVLQKNSDIKQIGDADIKQIAYK